MILFLEKYFNRIYWVLCLLVFAIIVLRAFFIPFSHDETSTFFFYVQSDNYLPYKAHVYTNNHVLNSALANICYHLAGSHRFVLRIPNMLAFWVLCLGVFKFFNYLKRYSSKLILITFFILTFNFLDFFELCRGYGLSMAFLVLGLSFLQDYFAGRKFKSLLFFSVFLQLALAANLILVEVFTILIVLISVFQIKHKHFFTLKNIVLLSFNLFVLIFWIKLSFFYRDKGVLDSGNSDHYWKITFQSLIEFIYGTDYLWILILIVGLFLLMLANGLAQLFKKPVDVFKIYEARLFYLFILSALIVAIYLQKKILDVNYPEDRTGLFLYILFALSITFFFENFNTRLSSFFAGAFSLASVIYFCTSFNLKTFTHYFYQVMPKEIYSTLCEEQEKSSQKLTIGGSLSREMNFAFMNYRGGATLNPMDISLPMCMNCDYYFALKREKPYYQFFYDEIAEDKIWDRVLLKRKEPIIRKELYTLTNVPAYYSGEREYFEFIRLGDTALKSHNCLEAEVELFFKKVPKPFRAFLVFSIDNTKGESVYYKRVPLNWLGDDLNGQKKLLKLTTGKLPADFKTMCVYVWNIDTLPVEFSVEKLKINELHAKGINFTIPEEFYPLVESITKKPLL